MAAVVIAAGNMVVKTVANTEPGLQVMFEYLQDAAEREDNVGVDEFPDAGALMEQLHIFHGQVFSVVDDRVSDVTQAFIIIRDTPLRRGPSIRSNIQIVRAQSRARDWDYFRDLLTVTQVLMRQVAPSYSVCEYQVAQPCNELLALLLDDGFKVVINLPHAIKLKNSVEDFHEGVYVCVKTMSEPVLQPVADLSVLEDVTHDDEFTKRPLRQHEFLREPYNIQISELNVNIRMMRKEETLVLFRWLANSSIYGVEGYALNEYTSLAAYEREVVINSYNVVFEDADTGTLIAAYQMTDSAYSRSASSRLIDIHIMVDPEYQQLGFSKFVTLCARGAAVAENVIGCVSEFFLHSTRTIQMQRHAEPLPLGVLPMAAFTAKHGWGTLCYCFYKTGGETFPDNLHTALGQSPDT